MVRLNNFKLVSEILFLNFFLFPIYPENFEPLFIGLFLVFAIYYALKKRICILKIGNNFTSLLIINTSLFVILLISLLYSNNLDFGLESIFRFLPLLIFPVGFFLLKDNKYIYRSKLFTIGKLLFYFSTLILFISIFLVFYYRGFVTENFFLNYSYRIIFQLGKFSMHPIYASIVTLIALIFSISLFKIKSYKYVIIFGNILLTINLFLLSRKSAIIIMCLLFLGFFLFNKKIKSNLKMFFSLFIALFLIVTIKFIPDISNRFNDLYSLLDANKSTSTNLRLNLINLSIDAIKEKPFLGYGIGDTKDVLSELEKQYDFFKGKYYNTHNQFLGFLISTGFLGLFIFLLFLFKNWKSAILGGYEQLSIIFLFVSFMFIENILERQNGVIFFSFFINYFSFYNEVNKSK
jgi:O-antigen ligase